MVLEAAKHIYATATDLNQGTYDKLMEMYPEERVNWQHTYNERQHMLNFVMTMVCRHAGINEKEVISGKE